MNATMDLSIIIVSYNSLRHLERCLRSAAGLKDNLTKEIILVDNGSSDGSAEYVKRNWPEVIVIENGSNMGYAGANNAGIRRSSGKYLMFLNPDTELSSDTAEKLAAYFEKTGDAGIVAPKLLYPDGALQYSCRTFYSLRTVFFRRFLRKLNSGLERKHLMLDWDHNSPASVDWVLAACIFTKRELMDKIGQFDEKYRLYFEDVDLCYRFAQNGYRTYYYPLTTVVHHHQRDSAKRISRTTLWHVQSMVRFFRKFGWKL